MFESIIFIFGYIVMMTLSFQGLLGALYKHFRFPKSKGSIKDYSGKSAEMWGIIFWVGFGMFALGISFARLETSTDFNVELVLFLLATVLSLVLAFVSRKYGISKI